MTIPPGLRRPVLRARRDTGFLAAGVLPHLMPAPVWVWGVAFSAKTGNWPFALPVSVALIVLGTPVLTAVQRVRHRVLLGVGIPRPTPAPERWSWEVAARWLSSTRTWHQVGYHLLLGPLLAVSELLVLVVAAVGLAGATAFGWAWALPAGVRQDWFGYATRLPCYAVGGVVLLCAVPWVAGAMARAESRSAAALLGPSRAQRLQERVDRLAESRTGLIEAVDAERRRIERDLHDGTQQRLVSLAVNLGLAMAARPDMPGETRAMIAEAHLEAKEAISELNDSESAVAKHINNIFAKLDLPVVDADHRRVLAVLRFLGASRT
ncbi:histidine kinase [Kitasatospora sp. NPDC056783]|uniref:histidine kinase n=1 Tax=Kitasatospora sp. NPDC056783 TaxID=3345943 RepID=UPI00367EADE2